MMSLAIVTPEPTGKSGPMRIETSDCAGSSNSAKPVAYSAESIAPESAPAVRDVETTPPAGVTS